MPTGNRLIAEPLDLESGGRILFDDPANIKAKDYRALKRISADVDSDNNVEQDAVYLAIDYLARILITEWHIPYLNGGNPPLPKDAPDLLGELLIIDRKQLELHLLPILGMYIWRWEGGISSGKAGEVPNQTPPAGE
jgi:hypothetical protein